MYAIDLNLKTRAPSQFMEFEFNSCCNFKGKALLSNKDGLFVLTGTSDDGCGVDAFFETVLSDWGSIRVKRPRFCFLTLLGGPVRLSIIDGDLVEQTSIEVPQVSASLPQVVQVAVPRTVAQRFWKFKFSNVNGSDFRIDRLDVLFVMRPHGLSKRT